MGDHPPVELPAPGTVGQAKQLFRSHAELVARVDDGVPMFLPTRLTLFQAFLPKDSNSPE